MSLAFLVGQMAQFNVGSLWYVHNKWSPLIFKLPVLWFIPIFFVVGGATRIPLAPYLLRFTSLFAQAGDLWSAVIDFCKPKLLPFWVKISSDKHLILWFYFYFNFFMFSWKGIYHKFYFSAVYIFNLCEYFCMLLALRDLNFAW